ncbi:carboxypeptidase-like regulatory domain-containing protein [Flavobacterium sp. SUN046]|uniref:carboxypeptidase-like regulatory domain-containing protein n=1 Tax=Flavobacterium sp. SUN046 TaxID=3002440 RepID=UPI002DBB3245|nr:carboxypeptidase-like regulatory domain-containing protein [Flavobacterium sp. SUN046]MEC4048739.1 carboxypeptidase-like regulatory domain-containing protein [Flavobacterium sp. SUN046]
MITKHYLYQKLSLVIILLVLSSFTILNSIKVEYLHGTVYDEFEKPLSEVEITNLNNSETSTSDEEGHFTIKGSLLDVLKFEYPSKTTVTLSADKFFDIKVHLVKSNPIAIGKLTPPVKVISKTTTIKVRGVVYDNSGPLPGANVFCKKSKTGTSTDLDGLFSMEVNKGDELEFSFIGMENQRIIVKDSIVKIKMKEHSSVTLDEVVITSGSRDSDSDDDAPSYKPSKSYAADKEVFTSLAGKATGIKICAASSADTHIIIRGASSSSTTTAALSDKSTVASTTIENKAGKLTAGELNDFSKWEYWKDLTKEELNQWQKLWEMSPTNRYSIIVSNEQGFPIINKTVYLKNEANETLWTARTDNTGRAELWYKPFDLSTTSTVENLKIVDSDNQLLANKPKEFRKGVNTFFYTHECNKLNKVNIAFMVDATGSMSDEIQYLQTELYDVIERTKKDLPEIDLSMGSVFYRDFGDTYLVKNFDFTSNIPDMLNFIKAQGADGGGDTPEAVIEGYEAALDKLNWDDESRTKLLFVILDAPPHYSPENVIKLQNIAKKAAEKGVRIIPIAASGIDKSTEYLMRAMALETNGTYLFITNHSGIGNNHIEPSTKSYKVEMLNDLILRIIVQYSKVNQCEEQNSNYTTNTKLEDELVTDATVKWTYTPNPTSGLVAINLDKDAQELYLYDTTGKLVLFQDKKAKEYQLDLTGLPNAVYYLKVITKDQSLYGKIIKKL